jgi:hypothetical protein
VIERWGLVAGVTGMVANLLLIALYVLVLGLGLAAYEWTGPANDVIGGIVSTGATIPLAFALRDVVGRESLVGVMTRMVVFALGTIVVLSTLLVVDVIPFEVQGVAAGLAIQVMFVWVGVVGRAGARNGTLPPSMARWAIMMASAAVLGALVVGSFLLPWASTAQYILASAGLLIGVPAYLAFPVWLIRMSNRLPAHADARAVHDLTDVSA